MFINLGLEDNEWVVKCYKLWLGVVMVLFML